MKNHKILSVLAIAGAILLTSCEGIVVNPGQKNYAGEFIEVTSTRTLTAEWMADEIIRMAPDVALIKDIIKDVIGHDFVITNIAYWTKDPSGKLVKASGIVSYVSDLTEYDHIVSSHHFTSDIVAAPSTRPIPPEMIPAWYGDAVIKRGTEPCRFTSFIAFLLRGLVYGDNLSVNLENLFTPRVVAAGMIKKFATTQQSTWQVSSFSCAILTSGIRWAKSLCL